MRWFYVILVFTALLHPFLCAKNSKEKKGPPKKANVVDVTRKALLANLSPGKTKTPGGTDVLKKCATMKRQGGDELTILKRYRSTDKSPHIGTMGRAATRLLTPHDESSLKRRLTYQAMSTEDREKLNEKKRLSYQAMSAEDREELNEQAPEAGRAGARPAISGAVPCWAGRAGAPPL